MTAKTSTPRMRVGRCACRFRYTTRLFDRHYQDHELLEPCGYHATQSRENAALRERLSESQHNWQVLNLKILAELRPPTVTEQSIPERVKAMRERLERAEKDAERYRWLRNSPGAKSAEGYGLLVVTDEPSKTPRYIGPIQGEGLDTAIDAALKEVSDG
jgi:hypothetical protein